MLAMIECYGQSPSIENESDNYSHKMHRTLLWCRSYGVGVHSNLMILLMNSWIQCYNLNEISWVYFLRTVYYAVQDGDLKYIWV